MAKRRKKKSASTSGSKSNHRPLKFLKAMHAKMERNLPKLEALIKKRGG